MREGSEAQVQADGGGARVSVPPFGAEPPRCDRRSVSKRVFVAEGDRAVAAEGVRRV